MDLEVLNLKVEAQAVERATRDLNDLDVALDKVDRAALKLNDTNKVLRGEQLRVAGSTVKLSDSLTKTQAGFLATMKQAGASANEIKFFSKQFENMNKIMGLNTFDKSANALSRMRKQTEELTKSSKYIERYNDLTKQQISLLTQGVEATRQRAMAEQKSFGQREAAVKKFIKEFVKEAQSYNQVASAIEEKNRAAREEIRIQQEAARAAQVSAKQRADAEKYVQETLQRTLFMNEQMDKGMSTSGASALYAYKQQLDLLGLSADQAAAKMQEFQSALTTKQGLQGRANPIRQMREDIHNTTQEVNQLARAVSVQLGDVFVSLAGGMNPLLVAIQQGDQIRFALEQAKAAGQGLDNVMRGAFASMANSFVLVGTIVKDFLIDGIMSAGKLITNFNTSVIDAIGRMVGLGNAASDTIKVFEHGAAAGNKFSAAMVGVMNASKILAGGLLLGIVAAIGTFAVASVKLSNDLDKLAVALNMSGASLGLTAQQAQQAAEKIGESYGTSIYDALDAVTLFATKNIQFTDEMIVSATELSRVTGKSLSDIIDSYSSLKGKPVEGLLEVAIATGQVNIETIKAIDKLVEQGKTAEATKLAMQEKARAEQEAARNTLAEMTPLGRLWIQMKKDVSELGEAVYDLVTKSVLVDVFAVAWRGVASVFHVIAWAVKGAGKLIGGIAAQLVALANLDFSGVMNIGNSMMSDAASGYRELEGTLKSLWTSTDELTKKELEAAAARRQANAAAASQFKKEFEERKKGANEAGKEAEKTQKYFEKLMEGASDLALKTQQEVSKLNSGYEQMTNSQKMLFDAQNDPRWNSLSERQKTEFENALKLIEANEELIRQYNAQVALQELLSKWVDDYDSAAISIKEEAAALELRNNLLFKTEEEAKAIQRQYDLNVKLAAVENKYIERRNQMMMDYVKLVQDGNWSPAALEEYQRNMAAVTQQEATERELAHQDANLKIVEDYEKKFREVQDTISDIVATALFEGGKSGSKRLKDVLNAEFRKYVINVLINPIVGNTMGAVSQSLGIGGQSGGVGSLLGGASNLQSLYGAVTGGITSTIGSAVGALGSAIGSSAVTSFAAGIKGSTLAAGLAGPTTAGASGAMGLGASFGAAIPWVAGGLAIANLLGAFDKKPSDKTSAVTVDLSTNAVKQIWDMGGKKAAPQEQKDANVILSQVVGGFAQLAGITGELVTAMGSRDGIRVAITGGFKTPEGAAGGGAWLGGKETIYSFGSDMETAIVAMLNDLVDEGTLDDSTIKSWRSLKDITKTSGEMIESLNALVGGYSEDVIRYADSVKVEGKTLTETLADLQVIVSSVNGVFDVLGYSLYELDTAGYSAANSLVALFGGIESFVNATSFYYDNFYTEEERIAKTTEQLTETFKQLGHTLPGTKEGFRQLVEMQDLTTESGRKVYATLMGVASAFVEISNSLESIYSVALSGANSSIDDMISAVNESIQQSKSSAKTWLDVSKALRESAKSIFVGIAGTSTKKNSLSEIIAKAIGGDIESAKSASGAATDYLTSYKGIAKSSVDFARESAKVANQLRLVAGVSELEAAKEAFQVTLMETQISVLNELKEYLQGESVKVEDIEAFRRKLQDLNTAINEYEKFGYADFKESVKLTIESVWKSPSLPTDVKKLLAANANGLDVGIDFLVMSDNLTAEQKWMALNTYSELDKVLKFTVQNDPSSDLIKTVLATSSKITKTISLVEGSGMTDELKMLALVASDKITKTIEPILAENVPDNIKRLALNTLGKYTLQMNPVIESENLSDAVKRIVFNQAGTYSAGIIAVVKDEEMSEAAKRITLQQQGQYIANIGGIISTDVSDSIKTLLLNANTSAFRSVTMLAVWKEALTADQRKMLYENSRTVSKVLSGGITLGKFTNDQLKMLRESGGVVDKVVNGFVNIGKLSQDQKNILSVLSGSEDGKITITGGFSFEPSKAFSTLYDGMTKEVAKLKFTDLIQSLNKLELAIRIQNEEAAAARRAAVTANWNKLVSDALGVKGEMTGDLASTSGYLNTKVDKESLEFVARYISYGNVQAGLGISSDKIPDSIENLMAYNRYLPDAEKLLESVNKAEIIQFAKLLQSTSTAGLRGDLGSTKTFMTAKNEYNRAVGWYEDRLGLEKELATIRSALNGLVVSYPDLFSAKDAEALKMFAVGGVFTNSVVSSPTAFSMGVMGEAGPEAIMPLTNVGGSLGVRAQMPDMEEVVDELRSLRGEVINLRAEVRADVSYNAKTAKLLDRVIPDGQSVSVKTAA